MKEELNQDLTREIELMEFELESLLSEYYRVGGELDQLQYLYNKRREVRDLEKHRDLIVECLTEKIKRIKAKKTKRSSDKIRSARRKLYYQRKQTEELFSLLELGASVASKLPNTES